MSSAMINLFGPSLQEEMQYVRYKEKDHTTKQGRRNVTQSEGASETSISSRVKTNPLQWISTLICAFLVRVNRFPYKRLCLRKKGKILRIILAEK